MTKTILVFSGGMDSTTLLYKLISEGKEVKAISFNYGQRHSRELDQASKTCQKLGIEHKIIDISFIKEIISNSALTGDIEVPEGHYADDNMRKTVVPNRNMIMSSIAIGWAVNLGYNEVALGIHAGDRAQYPDCRPEFVEALRTISKIANFESIDIYVPFLYLDKGDIVIEGTKLNTDYSITQTCYVGNEKPCMRCGSCVERCSAFLKAGVKDPLYSSEEWEETVKIHDDYQADFDSIHEKTVNT